MRRALATGVIALAALGPSFPSHAAPAAGAGSAPPTGTLTGAIQTGPREILVSLPNVCLPPPSAPHRADHEAALRRWLDGVRLYRLAKSPLDPPTPEKLAVEPAVTIADDCFFELRLTAAEAIRRGDDYRVVVDGLDVGSVLRLVPGAVDLAPRKLTLELDRAHPDRLEIETPSCGPEPEEITVAATLPVVEESAEQPGRRVKVDRPVDLGQDVAPRRSGLPPGPCRYVVHLDRPLRHDMKLAVAAVGTPLGTLTATGEVSFPAPKSKKDAELYLQVTAEAGEDEKPNLLVDFKFERQAAVYLGDAWTLGIELAAEIATKDSAETNKLRIGYPFHRSWLFDNGNGVTGVYGHFGPRVEADDVFANRNLLADLSFDLLSTSLAWDCWRRDCEIEPTLGYQWGENRRLEDDDLRELEGYSVSRAMAEVGFTVESELEGAPIRSFSFGVTYSGWYRFSRELDTFTGSDGGSAVRLEDGYVDYWTVALDLRLSEAFGVVLKYQTGERPVLFKDEDKASLGLSYRL